MFSLAAARTSPSGAAGRRLRPAAGPHRFATLWPGLQAQLLEARRSAAVPPDDRPETLPRVHACGGEA